MARTKETEASQPAEEQASLPVETAAESAAAPAAEPEASAPAPTVFQITLKEYMIKLSKRDRRVELINAFHKEELRVGTVKDFESAFDARLVAFSQQVVED